MPHLLNGLGVALVTPFNDTEIDFDALTQIVEHVIAGGVDFLVALGTTGESATLSAAEQEAVLRHIIAVNKGRKPIVAGHFGGNNTALLAQRLRQFDPEGVTAIMSSSPAYVKPSQEGIYQHYMQLAEASPLPIIIYNVPGRTASNIESATILRLAKASDKFIAVKEASADLVQCMAIMKSRPTNFALFSGDDPTAFPTIAAGGQGVISVIGNAFPHAFSQMTKAALAGDLDKAKEWNDLLLTVHPWLYVDGNPAGIKAALAHLGLCKNELRLPLVPMGVENEARLLEELKRMNASL